MTMRVWSGLVPWAKVSAQVDFGDLTEMAASAGLALPEAVDGLVIGHQMPPDPR
ncbi:hypothetical protein [Streptomyces sp. NPDC002845]